MDIYDRALWPSPDENPLIQLFLSGDDWISNQDINAAISLERASQKRSLISQWQTLASQIGVSETRLVGTAMAVSTRGAHSQTGGVTREFSRKALILIATRAQAVNAAAFLDWLASRMVEEVRHG